MGILKMSFEFLWIRMGILTITFRIPLDLHGNPQDVLQNFLILVQLSSTAAQQHRQHTSAQAAQQHLTLRGFPLELL